MIDSLLYLARTGSALLRGLRLGDCELRGVYEPRCLDPEALLETQHVDRGGLRGTPGDNRGRLVGALRAQDGRDGVDARRCKSGGGVKAAHCSVGAAAPPCRRAATPCCSGSVGERTVVEGASAAEAGAGHVPTRLKCSSTLENSPSNRQPREEKAERLRRPLLCPCSVAPADGDALAPAQHGDGDGEAARQVRLQSHQREQIRLDPRLEPRRDERERGGEAGPLRAGAGEGL